MMKLLVTGDWHLRFRAPRLRTDDYFASQFNKVEQILELAKAEDCKYILQPGDFFDGVETPWFVIQEYIQLLSKYNIGVLAVRGQHDLRYHSKDVRNIPLAVMEASHTVYILEGKGFRDRGVGFYGSSWGQQSVPEGAGDTDLNILLAHQMVINSKLWDGQEDYTYASTMLKKHSEYDLIVCGDNHTYFVEGLDGRCLVNCGSLMRANIDQMSHKPVVHLFDTGPRELSESIYLDVNPKVFNRRKYRQEKSRDEKLDTFVEGLKEEQDLGLDFLQNLSDVVMDGKLEDGVINIIQECIEND